MEIVNIVTAEFLTMILKEKNFSRPSPNTFKIEMDFGYQSFLITEWQQRVAQEIRDSEIYQTKYDLFDMKLITACKLLKAFCGNLEDMGFPTDPSEVYWVLCINPMLPEEKEFRTRYS